MAEVSIKVEGVDRLFAKLDKAHAIRTLEPPMRRGVLRLQAGMARYPAPPLNSTYRRTGTLGRRWTTKVTRHTDGLSGRVGNNTEYAPLVQSNRFQARVHRGRWQTDEQVMNREARAIVHDFQRAIRNALAGR